MKNNQSLLVPLLSKFEMIINKALTLDPVTQSRLTELNGKVFLIDIERTDIALSLLPQEQGVAIRLDVQDKVDVMIKGRPTALAGLLLNRDNATSVFPKELEVKGDINLAQQLQLIMRGLEIDWEEYLSEWIGDMAAHKFGNFLRSTGRFLKQASESLKQDSSEYLRYEKEILPDQLLINEFVQGVDEIRNDVERLKQRIERLQAG